MNDADYNKLLGDLEGQLLGGARPVAILGLTTVALQLLRSLSASGLAAAVEAIYDPLPSRLGSVLQVARVRPLADLRGSSCQLLAVASDEGKEELLWSALPHLRHAPKILVAGYAQYEFHDGIFDEVMCRVPVPPQTNGYRHVLTHTYQCLRNAARLGLTGVVAEFGMFKGGTTMVLAEFIKGVGADWRVIGFDSFRGFPERASALDMYDDPGCYFTDVDLVRSYLSGRNVEIVVGDIRESASRLRDEDIVLTFIDTDNYSAASAAIEVVRERTIIGGSIVFDHFAGVDRFRYTLGERMAARVLVDDARYFNLHGTGVFYRQR